MKYRLGLDVGTASCGLIALELDVDGKPVEPTYNSLNIWSEPLQPAKSGGVGQPKKAARRAARMMRRGIYRRTRKLRHIAHLAPLLGLRPSVIPPDAGQKIHRLRAQAAEGRIELDDLLRVLLRLAKNRGPSGDWVYADPEETRKGKKKSRKAEPVTDGAEAEQAGEAAKKSAEEKQSIVGGVRKLEGLMRETAVALGKSELTLGQYLAYRFDRGEGVQTGKPHIGLYPSRRMVETEFNQIWDKQAEFHPVLRDVETRQKFYDAIFYQRPLKSPAPMVGRCPLEPTLPRSPAAQMAAQAFRIEKQLADLRWGMGKRAEHLSLEQKAVIRRLLNEQAEVSFSTIRKTLEEVGLPSPNGRGLNMERASRDKLKGNSTLATMRKLELGAEWDALDEKTQIQVINFLADLGSPDALENDDWQTKFRKLEREKNDRKYKKPIRVNSKQWKYAERHFDQPFLEFIDRLRAHPKFGRLSAMGFDGGRMGYSIKALKKLTELMRAPDKDGVLYDERAAVDQAYPEHNKPKAVSATLPLPPETGNTVVDVALRQVYRAVRRAMETLGGPPAQVIVELSRDMALGVTKRGEIENKIKKNAKARRQTESKLKEHGEQATERNIARYQLWESQLTYCPYCAERIELGEALSSATEREHILPRSLTRVGGKRSQIVLAHKTCNQEKGNRTPWKAFHQDQARLRIIEERAAQFEKNHLWGKARLLLLKDWEDEVLTDEAIADFTDRQYHESSWIAKLTAQWLRSVCGDVSVSRGELTAHLRRIWKLDTVIPEVRYAQALPVLDRAEKPQAISLDDFKKHKSWWEGHDEHAGGVPTDRKPDKRIDHRHHLVDALVISLSDRPLFKAMADHYKFESERARHGVPARLTRYVEPPFTDLRDLAVEIVANAEIRHKPDRHPDGPFFDQSAYGVSRKPNDKGEHLLAISKSLKALIDIGGNAEKTRKALEKNIESGVTREAVLKAFDERIAAGTNIIQVFDEPILHPQFHTPIHRVRLVGNSQDTAAIVIHTDRQGRKLEKRYPHANNAYLEIQVDNGKLVGKPQLVTPQKAMKSKGSRPPPGVRRFWKGDTVQLLDGSFHLIGIIAAQGGGQLRLVPVTETCTFGELKKRGLTMRTVSGDALAQVTLIDV